MMFGFIFIFILLPFTGFLLLLAIIFRKLSIVKLTGYFWLGILCLIFTSSIYHFFTDPKELDKNDLYGEYIIDRTKYPGKQAEWQYNHYRFEIKPNQEFLFYITDQQEIVKKLVGKIEFVYGYRIPHIIIKMPKPSHHVIDEKPTLYRTSNGFYYVFQSGKFSNMFFVKGKWE